MTPFDSVLSQLALAMGASWCAGLNLYATVAVLGLMVHFVPGFQLPPDLMVLASPWVILPALFMYVVEFVADKVPAVDTLWDTIHTFIRVPAGAALAAAALGSVPPEVQVGAAIVGGTLALGSHTTKATARAAAHTTGTSPLVSPAASVVEDGLVIGTMALFATSPLLALGLTLLMVMGAVVLMWLLWSLVRKVFKVLTGRNGEAKPVGMAPSPAGQVSASAEA